MRLRLHETRGEFHPAMSSSRGEILISFTWLISPRDERKTVSSRDEINVESYLGVFVFLFLQNGHPCRKLICTVWSVTAGHT